MTAISDVIYPNNVPSNTISISPSTVTSGYLQVNGVTELKKRVTIRKFDKDGKVIEETVTEEYGDKEVVTIPTYPNTTPWYVPVTPTNPWESPYQPSIIYCSTTAGVDSTSTNVLV